jgi:hypothetical protein
MASWPDGEPTTVRQHIRKVENDADLELVSIAVAPRRTRMAGKHRVQSPHVFRLDRLTDQLCDERKNIAVAGGEIVEPALAPKAFPEFYPSRPILN